MYSWTHLHLLYLKLTFSEVNHFDLDNNSNINHNLSHEKNKEKRKDGSNEKELNHVDDISPDKATYERIFSLIFI